jgi:hypothetical protein
MPFAVILLPTDASPRPGQLEAELRRIVAAEAGPIGADGAVHPARGAPFTLDRGDFSLERLSPLSCRVIFDAARQTNSIVIASGEGGPYLMMKGSTGKLDTFGDPDPGPPVKPVVVPDPPALCVRLGGALRLWNHDMARARQEGFLDANDRPIMPPGDPGSETPISSDPSGVAAYCEQMIVKEAPAMSWTIRRRLVTRSEQWGVVWRADVVPKDYPESPFRQTCWRWKGRKPGYGISAQPLEMFDPKASLKPLPEQ